MVEILNCADAASGTASTAVIWESADDVRRYRQGELIKEATAFEESLGAR